MEQIRKIITEKKEKLTKYIHDSQSYNNDLRSQNNDLRLKNEVEHEIFLRECKKTEKEFEYRMNSVESIIAQAIRMKKDHLIRTRKCMNLKKRVVLFNEKIISKDKLGQMAKIAIAEHKKSLRPKNRPNLEILVQDDQSVTDLQNNPNLEQLADLTESFLLQSAATYSGFMTLEEEAKQLQFIQAAQEKTKALIQDMASTQDSSVPSIDYVDQYGRSHAKTPKDLLKIFNDSHQ